MGLIADTLLSYLPARKKKTPSGWISFNAPCCGDKRQRGGFIIHGGDAVSYHCFNCGFTASWQPGRKVSQKLRKLMIALGISDDLISKLSLDALSLKSQTDVQALELGVPTFTSRSMPMESRPISEFIDNPPAEIFPVLEYMASRNLTLDDYPFYWTPKEGFTNRLIIPFFKDGMIVGHTSRSVDGSTPKYISEQQPGYVFNLDRQDYSREFVIVCEGPIDGISIDGCALMGAEISDQQHFLLKQLGKQIIVVPDRDHEGLRTVEQAIEYGYSVSMPEWPEDVKDINDAIVKIGKLATLWAILSAVETTSLNIQLRAKKWFK